MSTTQTTVVYQGKEYKLVPCNKCQKPIFFINVAPQGAPKPDWELHNPDLSLHDDHKKKGGGGYNGSPPAKPVDGVVLVEVTPDPILNQNTMSTIAGWKINRLKDGEVQLLSKGDKVYVVMVHET